MSKHLQTMLVFAALAAVALAFRLPQLAERPMHGDEANQAYRAGILYDTGVYEYDPHEHHGPTLYYFALPFLWLSGAADFQDTTEYPYRLGVVFFGVGLILLLWLVRDALGLWGVFWAGLLMAVSPAMVYYSRYFIQETLLIFFAFAAIGGGWRYFCRPHWGWAALVGASLGLVHATKETSVIIFSGMGFALLVCVGLALFRKDLKPVALEKAHLRHGALLVGVALAVSVVLYTSFFTHWRGPLDSLLTYATYMDRAEGVGSTSPHDKPWYYYLGILIYTHWEAGPVWSEAFVLMAGLLGVFATLLSPQVISDKNRQKKIYFWLFISVYGVFLLFVYSAIPYKTPWNLLPFYQPIALMAGLGVMSVMSLFRSYWVKSFIFLVVCVGIIHLGRVSLNTNFIYPADTRNPYVYAHTSTALMRLADRIDDLTEVSGQGADFPIHIIKPDADYWPLPWYLRQYGRVGYWPALPDPPPPGGIYITDVANAPLVSQKLGGGFIVENHALRPNVRLVAFIEPELWAAFMENRR